MPSDQELESSAAFDEHLRAAGPDARSNPQPANIRTSTADVIRLLHEVFREGPQCASPPGPGSPASPPPQSIGRFHILRVLGSGGFGTVYLADDPVLRRRVAVKLFHPHVLGDPSARARVLLEREVMARLQHANIIPVWEAGEDGEKLYIVSEYCRGPTLAQWFADRNSPLTPEVAADWVRQLADAVAHSHQRGIIHRDLKPGNVLLEPTGDEAQSAEQPPDERSWRPRLSDFGLAKYLSAAHDSAVESSSQGQTQSGLFIGSLEYASPEQIRGLPGAVGPASDIYSMGVLLFQLLTGRLPHTADSQYDLARLKCEVDASFPSGLRSRVPRDLQAIALRALQRNPQARYASAEALRDDLQRFLTGQSVSARPVPIWEQAWRWADQHPSVALLSVMCLLLAVLFVQHLVVSNRRLTGQSRELQLALDKAQRQSSEIAEQREAAQQLQRRAEQSEAVVSQVSYHANMRLAFDQWQQGNYIGSLELLNRVRSADNPGIEWTWLRRILSASYARFDGLPDTATGLVIDPSSGMLISVGESGIARWWEPDSRRLVKELRVSPGAHALAVSPDGQTLATPQRIVAGGRASTIEFWNLRSGERRDETMHHHSTTIESLEFSPDGRWLASGPRYAPVIVTNLETRESFAIKSGRRNRQISFSPQSDRLAVYVDFGKLHIVDLATRQLHRELSFGGHSVMSHAWVPNSDLIIVNAADELVYVASAKTGATLESFDVNLSGESIAVSPEGKYFAIGSGDGVVQTFRLETSRESTRIKITPVTRQARVLDGYVADIAFVNSTTLVACDEEGGMIWLDVLPKIKTLSGRSSDWRTARWEHEREVHIFNRRGAAQKLVLNSASIRLEEVDRPELSQLLPALTVAVSNDRARIASVDAAGVIKIADRATGAILSTTTVDPGKAISAGGAPINAIAFSPDDRLLLATGENNRLSALDANGSALVWEQALTNTGHCLAFNRLGQVIVGGSFETLRVCDLKTGDLVGEHLGGNGAYALWVDQDRQRLLSGHADGGLRMRDLELKNRATVHRGPRLSIDAITLTPDRRTIITGHETGAICLWNSHGDPFGIIYQSAIKGASVRDFAWSPDGRVLLAVVCSNDRECELVFLGETAAVPPGER